MFGTKKLIEKIEELENRIEILEFKDKHNTDLVVKIKTNLFSALPHNVAVTYVDYNKSCLKDLIIDQIFRPYDTQVEVKKNDKNASIIKIDNCWFMLDKVKGCVYEIPEPAEFAEGGTQE